MITPAPMTLRQASRFVDWRIGVTGLGGYWEDVSNYEWYAGI